MQNKATNHDGFEVSAFGKVEEAAVLDHAYLHVFDKISVRNADGVTSVLLPASDEECPDRLLVQFSHGRFPVHLPDEPVEGKECLACSQERLPRIIVVDLPRLLFDLQVDVTVRIVSCRDWLRPDDAGCPSTDGNDVFYAFSGK